jgi:hypothetical protein
MVMSWQDVALGTAGFIGSGVAVAHGIIMQKRMISPLGQVFRADERMSGPIRRLVPLLLHFSTFNWFVSGLALIAAAIWFPRDARLATGLLAGSSYLFGALGNFWGTRGRHPGWALYTIALGLIGFGLS